MSRHAATPASSPVGEVRQEVLDLADKVRELIEAAVHTEVPADERREVAAQIAQATERLRAARRDTPQWVARAQDALQLSVNNPVEGVANPLAPPLSDFTFADGVVEANAVLSTPYEGAPARAHGGWVAALLDHMAGRATAHAGHPSMTVSLTVDYKSATPIDVPLALSAHVTEREGRKVFVAAQIVADGVVTATARAIMVEVNGLPQSTAHTSRD